MRFTVYHSQVHRITVRSTEPDIRAAGGKDLEPESGLASLALKLDEWFGTHCCVLRLDGNNNMACDGGIIIDRREILQYIELANLSPDYEDSPLMMTLIHERVHWQQIHDFPTVAEFEAAYQQNATLYELEADFAAAAYIGGRLEEQDINFLPLLPYAAVIGNPDWCGVGHPHPFSRALMVSKGLNCGAVEKPDAQTAMFRAAQFAQGHLMGLV